MRKDDASNVSGVKQGADASPSSTDAGFATGASAVPQRAGSERSSNGMVSPAGTPVASSPAAAPAPNRAAAPTASPVSSSSVSAPAFSASAAGFAEDEHEGLRRVKKKRHRGLKRAAIVLGVVVGILLLAGGAFAIWLGSLQKSMSFKNEADREELRKVLLSTDKTEENAPFYVLILGSDAREGDTQSRSDVMMLARVDAQHTNVELISIPRDTMVTINGSTEKINAAYALGGPAGAVACVNEFAGIEISHYVEVHFQELKTVVDALGGVWVNVPQSFSAGNGGMDFSAGNQLLNGDQALAFARERYHVKGGDFGRAQAQRMIMEAIINQVLQCSPVELPGVIGKLANSVSTDYSIGDMVKLAQQFVGKPLTMYSAACPSYTYNMNGVSYVATMFDEWRAMMQRVDAGLDPNDDAATVPEEQAQNAKLGQATNSAAPRDYHELAQNAMTTDDVAAVE